VALGANVPGEPITGVETLGRAKLVAVAAHEGPLTRAARVVLPATSWAEHSGTYVNAKGLRQVGERALLPQGASKPAWEQITAVAGALGVSASWTKLKQIRTELAIDHAERTAEGPITTGVTMGIV
jgi:NADH-quinone oxidoreductase subunit G